MPSDIEDVYQDYPQLIEILTSTVRPLLLLPLAEMAAANEHMQALGPILAATAYRDGGGTNLHEQRLVIDAALALRCVLDSLAPQAVSDGR